MGGSRAEEQGAVFADYKAINETPGVTPGVRMGRPRRRRPSVQDGKTLTTDGPFVETKEALGGYLFFEADDLDAAIELAARIPRPDGRRDRGAPDRGVVEQPRAGLPRRSGAASSPR